MTSHTAPGLKTARVKFVDGAKGYGYLIEDGESDPRVTVLFEQSVVEPVWASLKPGDRVEYRPRLSHSGVALMVRERKPDDEEA